MTKTIERKPEIKRLCDLDLEEDFTDDITVTAHGVRLGCSGYDYFIERSRINSAEKLLAWILHLTEKTWMDLPHMRYFVQQVARQYKISIEENF